MSLLRLASWTTKPGETGGAALGSCKSIITVPYEHFHISFVNIAIYRNRGAGGKTKGAWRESQKGEGWRERGKEGGRRRRVEFWGVKEVGSACSFRPPF